MSPPRRIEELHDQASRLWRGGQVAEAEQIYRTMMDEVRAAADTVPDRVRADAHHRAARFYRDTGRMEEAETFARGAVAFEERAGRAVILANHRMFLAQLLERRGEFGEALAQAELALDAEREAMGPEHSETRYYASVVAKLRQRLGEG